MVFFDVEVKGTKILDPSCLKERTKRFISVFFWNWYFSRCLNAFGAFMCFGDIRVSPSRLGIQMYSEYPENIGSSRYRSKDTAAPSSPGRTQPFGAQSAF